MPFARHEVDRRGRENLILSAWRCTRIVHRRRRHLSRGPRLQDSTPAQLGDTQRNSKGGGGGVTPSLCAALLGDTALISKGHAYNTGRAFESQLPP